MEHRDLWSRRRPKVARVQRRPHQAFEVRRERGEVKLGEVARRGLRHRHVLARALEGGVVVEEVAKRHRIARWHLEGPTDGAVDTA